MPMPWGTGLPLTLNFGSLNFQGVNFGSLERKTWKSGTSKGDRWTTVQITMYMFMEIIALINLLAKGKK